MRKKNLAIALLFGMLATPPTQADLNEGLVAYWSFDNCDATDDSGNGYDGTLFGNPECVDGVEGKASNIDAEDDYIELNQTLDTNQMKSFSFWLFSRGRGNGSNDLGTVIAKYHWSDKRSFILRTYDREFNAIRITYFKNGTSTEKIDSVSSYYDDPESLKEPDKYTIINNKELEINTWKHVVVNTTSTEIEIWIDGEITNKVKRSYQSYFDSDETTYIGNTFHLGDDFIYNHRLNGILDEFRIYNRALSETEIKSLRCANELTITPSSQSHSANAESGTVAVTASARCFWTASSNVEWVTITAGESGQGDGTVTYSITPNLTPQSREGSITIAGQTFTITQEGIECTITPTSRSHSANAESGTVAVSGPPICSSTASSNADWVTITADDSGTVSYSITANPSHQSREGTLSIGGQTFTITQEGIECTYSISPTSQFHSSNIETGDVRVSAPGDCPWSASSDITWANITSDSSGEGDGTVTYAIKENMGATREGTLSIAGQTFTLTQACKELAFTGLKDTYAVGELIELDLVACVTAQSQLFERADLWVAIMTPNGDIFFMTDLVQNPFSLTPQAFKKSVENIGAIYQLLRFEVPADVGGKYTFYAAYVKEGKNPVTDGFSVLLSDMAVAETILSNRPPLTQTPGEMFQDTLQDGSLGPEMVWIPAGTFRMGDIQGGGYSNEGPVHEVSVDSFAMGRYEVTFAEYDKFAQATGKTKPDDKGWGRGNRPVIEVSWDDAVAYAQWLSQQTGKQYRLPNEAEWEYAARAGTESKYWWSNDIGTNQANCYNSDCADSFDYTAPVGSFAPNPFGLYDMAGNVWEWSCSSYESRYDGQEQQCAATDQYRVVRGSGWNGAASYCRAAFRSFLSPDERGDAFGFRLLRIHE